MHQRKITPYLSSLAMIAAFILLLIFGRRINETVHGSLGVTVSRVIPTLFPYMVLSSIAVNADLLRPLYSIIPTECIFSLPHESASVMMTGMICGFPVGASGSADLYERGCVSQKDASVLCAISSAVSPSFLIGCVGELWNCRTYALMLYLAGIFVNITAGILMRQKQTGSHTVRTQVPCSSVQKKTPTEILCRAVSDAAQSCLAVTAFITFFRCAAVVITSVFPALEILLLPVFEFSSGVMAGAETGGMRGAVITGFSVGFSGLSVLMQISNFTSKYGISIGPTVILSFIRGIILAVLSAFFFTLHTMKSDSTAAVFSENIPHDRTVFTFILLSCFIIVCNIVCRDNNFRRKY